MWTLAWDAHAFVRQPLSIFDANIYYPEHRTLAYSENLIGSAVIAAPVLWLTDNPVLAMNIVALLSCVLCGVGAYVLGRRLGMGPPAAVLAGIIFAFSPPRFFRLSQLHLTTIQWVPFGLASLHAYFDAGRKSDLRLALAFFTLQALTSGHGAVFLLLAMLSLALYLVVTGEPLAFSTRAEGRGLARCAVARCHAAHPDSVPPGAGGNGLEPFTGRVDQQLVELPGVTFTPPCLPVVARAWCANQRDCPGIPLPWISPVDSCGRGVRVGQRLRPS